MTRHIRSAFAPALLLLSLFAAGCDADPSGSSQQSVQGTYTLRSVNGNPVPALIFEWNEPNDAGVDEAYRFEIAGGTLTLGAGGRFTATGIMRTVNVSRQTVDDVQSHNAGTWAMTGGTLSLVDRDGQPVAATLQGRDLTVELLPGDPASLRYVFRKD